MYKIKGGANLHSSCPTSSSTSLAVNADQALELLLGGTTDELHSEDELEIDEDIALPLPVHKESDQSEFEDIIIVPVKYKTLRNSKTQKLGILCHQTLQLKLS